MMDYMVEEMRPEDSKAVAALGMRFLEEGPYKGVIEDMEFASALAFAGYVAGNKRSRILVARDGEEPVGVFAFVVHEALFTSKMVAGELIWYVAPEHRPGGVALKMLKAAEDAARSMGAEYMNLTAPTEAVGELYKRCGGYRQVEVSFQRRLCQQ